MRKTFIFLFLVFVLLLLAACEAESIAIIGGADGPTSILVSEANEEIWPVRMICVAGDYYYDTGVFNNVPRCGNLDGSLAKTAEALEVPKGENSANFDVKNKNYFGYQSGTSITKDVLIDGEWVVFRRVESFGEDLSRYKLCFKICGRHPNAAVDSEYLVMTNEMDIDFEKITKHFFGSQIQDHQLDAHIVSVRITDEWGVKMSVRNVTPTGLTVTFEQLGGNPQGELQTGSWYSLEKYMEGRWEPAQTVLPMDMVAWDALAYPIGKNEISEFYVDWKWLYGELSPGTYRISKEIMDFTGTGNFKEKVYSVQFVIE